MEEKTGLIKPKAGAQMIQEDGVVVPVPKDSFIHPQTGHVLPIQGNIAFDPVTSRLVFVVDSATGLSQAFCFPFCFFKLFFFPCHLPVVTFLKPFNLRLLIMMIITTTIFNIKSESFRFNIFNDKVRNYVQDPRKKANILNEHFYFLILMAL